MHDWVRWANIDQVKLWIAGIISDEKKVPEFLGGAIIALVGAMITFIAKYLMLNSDKVSVPFGIK